MYPKDVGGVDQCNFRGGQRDKYTGRFLPRLNTVCKKESSTIAKERRLYFVGLVNVFARNPRSHTSGGQSQSWAHFPIGWRKERANRCIDGLGMDGSYRLDRPPSVLEQQDVCSFSESELELTSNHVDIIHQTLVTDLYLHTGREPQHKTFTGQQSSNPNEQQNTTKQRQSKLRNRRQIVTQAFHIIRSSNPSSPPQAHRHLC